MTATVLALAGCGHSSSGRGGGSGRETRPTATGPFHCPPAAFVSEAVGFEVTVEQRVIICQYAGAGDAATRSVEIAHERGRYAGKTLADLRKELLETAQLADLGLDFDFPAGGPQAWGWGTPGTNCQYWVYTSDTVPSSVDAINGDAGDCETSRRLAEAIALQ